MKKVLATLFLFVIIAVVSSSGVIKDLETEQDYSLLVPAVEEHIPIVLVKYPTVPLKVKKDLIKYINDRCAYYNVPVPLFYKLIENESKWGVNQASPNYDKQGNVKSIDYGLCQLNSLYIEEFLWFYRDRGENPKVYDVIKNPKDNVEIALRHLVTLYRNTGSWRGAIQAYNCGLSRYKSGKIPASTLKYVEKICPVEDWWLEPRGVELVY